MAHVRTVRRHIGPPIPVQRRGMRRIANSERNTDRHTPFGPSAIMNLPNKLTIARIIMVPILMGLLYVDHVASYLLAYFVFLAAVLTDHYDGKIARARGLVTNFGKLLDPLADKILIATTFIMLMDIEELHVPSWTVIAIIAREFLITGARSLAAAEGVVIAANVWGKIKTVLQMTYVFVFLGLVIIKRILAHWRPDLAADSETLLQQGSLYAAALVALFTIYSGVRYAQLNWRTLMLGGST